MTVPVRHNPCSVSPTIYFVLGRIFSLLLDLIAVAGRSDHEKDLEILLLRQQVRILQRMHSHSPRLSRWEKVDLAVLAARLVALSSTGRSRVTQAVLVFKPDTLLKWHRELVRRKWTFMRRQTGGRPQIAPDVEALILRLAKENPRWGLSWLSVSSAEQLARYCRPLLRRVHRRSFVRPNFLHDQPPSAGTIGAWYSER